MLHESQGPSCSSPVIIKSFTQMKKLYARMYVYAKLTWEGRGEKEEREAMGTQTGFEIKSPWSCEFPKATGVPRWHLTK